MAQTKKYASEQEKRDAFNKRRRELRKNNLEWRQKHREQQQKWRADNPDKVRDASKKWKDEHRGDVREYNREWRIENKDKVREYDAEYRVVKKKKRIAHKLAGTHCPIMENGCYICGKSEDITLLRHHDDYDQPLDVKIICSSCNKFMESKWKNLTSDEAKEAHKKEMKEKSETNINVV